MESNICLSHILTQNTPSYGNRDGVFIRVNSSIRNSESANSSSWFLSNNHIGTHIDSPHHFSQVGQKTYEIPVGDFIFNNVHLVDVPCANGKLITIQDISSFAISENVELLLIRTGYELFRSDEKYWKDGPGLAAELASYFRNKYPQLRCVGFDFISLTSWNFRDEGKKSHMAFLCPENGARPILIIEDMAIARVSAPINWTVVAPMFVEDGNGGAVTIFANVNTAHEE